MAQQSDLPDSNTLTVTEAAIAWEILKRCIIPANGKIDQGLLVEYTNAFIKSAEAIGRRIPMKE